MLSKRLFWNTYGQNKPWGQPYIANIIKNTNKRRRAARRVKNMKLAIYLTGCFAFGGLLEIVNMYWFNG